MKLLFSEQFQNELESIYNYLSPKSERAASKIYNDILDEINRLLIFPQMASVEPLLKREKEIYRSLVVRQYKVIYYIDFDTINVVDIWDCRRDPETLKQRIIY